jgi:hypothetical protein
MLENVATRDWEEAFQSKPTPSLQDIIDEKDEIIFDLIQKNGELEAEIIRLIGTKPRM